MTEGLFLHCLDFLTCLVFAFFFCCDSEHLRKIAGACLLSASIGESVLIPEDLLVNIYYAVLGSGRCFCAVLQLLPIYIKAL